MFTWGPISRAVAVPPQAVVLLEGATAHTSVDAGATWGTPESPGFVSWNAYRRLSTGRRFVNRSGGSTTAYNDGAGWVSASGGTTPYSNIAFKSGMFLGGLSSNLFRSVNNGATWTLVSSAGVVLPMTYSPTLAKFVCVDVNGGTVRIYLSTDGSDVISPATLSSPFQIGLAQTWGQNIVLTYSNGVPCVIRSTNGGVSYTQASGIFAGSGNPSEYCCVDPVGGIMLVVVNGSQSGLTRTANAGASWSAPALINGTWTPKSVIWTGVEFLANASSGGVGRIFASPDGLTWTLRGVDPSGTFASQLARDSWWEGGFT
jgi:hypothetical protein